MRYPSFCFSSLLLSICSIWINSTSKSHLLVQGKEFGQVSPYQSSCKGFLDDWIHAKCGRNGKQLWKYQGGLYDPLNGHQVLSVLGVELVRRVPSNQTESLSLYQNVLLQPDAPPHRAETLLSRRFFCYTVPDSDATSLTDDTIPREQSNGRMVQTPNNRMTPQLLQDIRIRPYSPKRRVPIHQAMAAYETATTWIEAGGKLLVYSEWPSPRATWGSRNTNTIHVWGAADTKKETTLRGFFFGGGSRSLSFTLFTKRQTPQSRLYWPDLIPPSPLVSSQTVDAATNNKENNATIVVSPKRSAWVSFGLGEPDAKHKIGIRETYTMTEPVGSWGRLRNVILGSSVAYSSSPNRRLTYTRYGEGPPFYAPGRMCMLELTAEPLDHERQLPPLVQELLRTHVTGWQGAPFYSPMDNDQIRNETKGAASHRRNYPAPWFGLRAPISEPPTHSWSNYLTRQGLKAWTHLQPVAGLIQWARRERTLW